MIYIIDHLWDVKKIKGRPSSGRHSIYFEHYTFFKYFAIILLPFVLISSLLFLSFKVIVFGFLLGLCVAGYLCIVHYCNVRKMEKWFHKEIFVGLIYGLGIWGSAALLARNFEVVHWILGAMFVMIAIQNLLIFSVYEQEEDLSQNQQSIVQVFGQNTIKKSVILIALLVGIMGTIILIFFSSPLIRNWVIIEWIMVVILVCIVTKPEYFKKSFAYRWVGDGVFILPAILWLWVFVNG